MTKLRVADMPKFDEVSESFTPAIIRGFIKSEGNGKAAGCSGISTELMKPVASKVAMILSLIAEVMYSTGLCPGIFRESNIIPVPKKTNSNNIQDFRPISLTEVPRRIIEKCWLCC